MCDFNHGLVIVKDVAAIAIKLYSSLYIAIATTLVGAMQISVLNYTATSFNPIKSRYSAA